MAGSDSQRSSTRAISPLIIEFCSGAVRVCVCDYIIVSLCACGVCTHVPSVNVRRCTRQDSLSTPLTLSLSAADPSIKQPIKDLYLIAD